MNYRIYFTTLACLVLIGSPAWAVVTIDRDYRLGDAPEEAVVFDGLEVGTNFQFNGDKFTADSMNQGAPNFYDAQDLQAFGAPVYRDVSARPIISSGFGIEFDGVDDVLSGAPLNILEESAGTIPNFPFIYAGLRARGLQMWVKPDAAGLAAGVRQTIVMDTDESGGVAITADGKWTQAFDDELGDANIPGTVPVVAGQWYHVMHHIYPSTAPGAPRTVVGSESGMTGVVYVNGIAVSASNDFPDTGGSTGSGKVGRLTVGAAEIANQDNDPLTAEYGQFFDGTIDDLKMYVYGNNSNQPGGQNYGTFDLFADNEWIKNQIMTTIPGGILKMGDVNKDGVVSGNGLGSAATDDVRAFIDGWLSQKRITGWGGKVSTVGDWLTWNSGDMNHDGITDLRDWAIINAANPTMGGAILAALNGTPVPEPSSILMIGLACLVVGRFARRRVSR